MILLISWILTNASSMQIAMQNDGAYAEWAIDFNCFSTVVYYMILYCQTIPVKSMGWGFLLDKGLHAMAVSILVDVIILAIVLGVPSPNCWRAVAIMTYRQMITIITFVILLKLVQNFPKLPFRKSPPE